MENVCYMRDVGINLTISGTPLANVTGVKYHADCSKLKAGTRFNLTFNATGPLPTQDTIITEAVVLQAASDEIPCTCLFNKDHFNCATLKDAKSEGSYYLALMESDYIHPNYSIMYFKIVSPMIKYSETCPN